MTDFIGGFSPDTARAKAEFKQELLQLSLAKIGALFGERPENMVVHAFYDLPDLRAGAFSQDIYNGYKLDTSPGTVSLLRHIKDVSENKLMPIVAVAFKTVDENNGYLSGQFMDYPDIYPKPKYSADGLRVVSRAICYTNCYLNPGDRMLWSPFGGWLDCGVRQNSQTASSRFPLRIYETVYTPDYPLTNAMLTELLQENIKNLYFQTPYDFIQMRGAKGKKRDAAKFNAIASRMESAPEFGDRKLISLVFKHVSKYDVPGVGKFCRNPVISHNSFNTVIAANLIAKNKDGKFETHPRGWTQTGEYAVDTLWPENGIGYQKTDWVKTMLDGYRRR